MKSIEQLARMLEPATEDPTEFWHLDLPALARVAVAAQYDAVRFGLDLRAFLELETWARSALTEQAMTQGRGRREIPDFGGAVWRAYVAARSALAADPEPLSVMSPGAFKLAVLGCKDQFLDDSVSGNYDTEAFHSATDELMEDLLISLGYGAAVEIIRDGERWYA